ncbi:MAG TPA: hypothetical protein HPQ00_15400, partial [Magnetococcales bacterium]|nr:hypothetical protein [Magnetococcales bacterium]
KLQGRLVVNAVDGKPKIFMGVTRNLGLGGALLSTFQPLGDFVPGDEGSLELGNALNKKVFAVQMIHLNPKGIGMKIVASSAELGDAIVALLSGDNQVRMGADLMPQENIPARLSLDDGRVLDVRLETVNSGQFECSVAPEDVPPAMGLSARVEISLADGSVQGECVVRKVENRVAMDGSASRTHVSALFSVMADADREKIKLLVADIHKRRLDAILQGRSMASALFSEGDVDTSQSNKREHVSRQLGTFFGHKKPPIQKTKMTASL